MGLPGRISQPPGTAVIRIIFTLVLFMEVVQHVVQQFVDDCLVPVGLRAGEVIAHDDESAGGLADSPDEFILLGEADDEDLVVDISPGLVDAI